MIKLLNLLVTLMVGLSPGNLTTPVDTKVAQPTSGNSTTLALSALKATTAAKKTTVKTCEAGYAINPATNRCKKLQTVSETSTTITTKVWNPATGETSTFKTCKSGYWYNNSTDRCNKIKTCDIGYAYQAATNTCKKIECPFGFKVKDASNVCKRIICEFGHIINQQTGNCVINRHGKYKECEAGWTLDLRTLECAKIGTKGSNDPASRRSQGVAVYQGLGYVNTVSSGLIRLAEATDNANENEDSKAIENSDNTKTCPEGKFLNPQANRCKNLQTISEGTTGKTITTYNPETGEATTVKICNEGYYLNEDTNRCNKVKESTSGTSSASSSNSPSSGSTKTCPEGKFLNPATNRCKNIQTVKEGTTGKTVTTYDPVTGEATTEKICNEGYELNQETNRCNKVKENSGADSPLTVPKLGSESETNFMAIGVVALVILAGIGFIGFQFRKEILKFFKNAKKTLTRRFSKK